MQFAEYDLRDKGHNGCQALIDAGNFSIIRFRTANGRNMSCIAFGRPSKKAIRQDLSGRQCNDVPITTKRIFTSLHHDLLLTIALNLHP
jgi:hypothetical protein